MTPKHSLPTSTQCVHAGTREDVQFQGLNSPIYTSSAFGYLDTPLKAYPRYFNTPNQENICRKLSQLEGAEASLFFSSGMAAISTAILGLMQHGQHAVFQNDLYGGTHHFISREMTRCGLSYTFVDSMKAEDFAKAIRPNTRLIYVETPSNPLLKLLDLRAIAELAREHGLVSLVDNTFASPINQQPLSLGMDVVLHSATKYIGGHSDLCAGALASSRTLIDEIYPTAINYGGSPEAQTCYLIERSMKTLAIRVRQQNRNAQALAEFLAHHPAVRQVNYPGLPEHPDHELAKRQMHGFGGMLSFELAETLKVDAFLKALRVLSPAMSLGGVETTINASAQTSHAKMTPEARRAAGISDRLLRLSCGIEEPEDLIDDLQMALKAAQQAAVPS